MTHQETDVVRLRRLVAEWEARAHAAEREVVGLRAQLDAAEARAAEAERVARCFATVAVEVL